MKIAILTCGMLPIPAVQGGAVENLIDFYLEYNDRHHLHDITVYSPRDSRVVSHPALISKDNHYVFIDVSSQKARIARKVYGYLHHDEYYNHFIEYYFEKVYSRLKLEHFDLIILENSVGYAYKLSLRGHQNLILHLHNDLLHQDSRWHEKIANRFRKVITVSNYVKARVSTACPSKYVKTVYNGIDVRRFTASSSTVSRQSLGFADADFVMVYSGRINQEKGISELLDAMLRLKHIDRLKLLILGSSFFEDAHGENDFIRHLKDKSGAISQRMVFTGFIPYSQVPDYLHLADIAVLPSIWEEPFGLTIVEALAAGLPLITTRSGGIPEICEGVAAIVDREDIVNNLTAAILDLYEHPEKRRQMADASAERAKLFDKESYAKNFFDAIGDSRTNE